MSREFVRMFRTKLHEVCVSVGFSAEQETQINDMMTDEVIERVCREQGEEALFAMVEEARQNALAARAAAASILGQALGVSPTLLVALGRADQG